MSKPDLTTRMPIAAEVDAIGELYKKAVREGDHLTEALCQMCFGLRVLGMEPQAAIAATEWKDATRDQALEEVRRRLVKVH